MTETEARGRGLSVRVARLPAEYVPRAMTSGERRGYLKAVVDADTDKVLGASILAAHGGEVMAVIQVAMRAGLPYTALRDMVFAHHACSASPRAPDPSMLPTWAPRRRPQAKRLVRRQIVLTAEPRSA